MQVWLLSRVSGVQSLFVSMKNPLLGVLVGLVATVLIQSSSASVGILQALSSTGLVTFGSLRSPLSWAHISVPHLRRCLPSAAPQRMASGCLYPSVFQCGGQCDDAGADLCSAGAVWGAALGRCDDQSSIANIHTLSSVAAMLLLLPFSGLLLRLSQLTVPSTKEEVQELSMPVLDDRLFKSPAVALKQAKSAVVRMGGRAARNVGWQPRCWCRWTRIPSAPSTCGRT